MSNGEPGVSITQQRKLFLLGAINLRRAKGNDAIFDIRVAAKRLGLPKLIKGESASFIFV